ncbi:MAG TPA: SDR family NAD(P)-dependent oxidoreductase, partial [Pseudolabrys sp.]|nr:SDR family NAD(P)-dependent oxidoreductase [Pseudolabrys sp.]
MGDLKDKIILVTGAAGAIGGAASAAIRNAGGTAIATDLAGRAGINMALDVTAEAQWRGVMDAIEQKQNRLDGLVNAAGIAAVGSIEKTDLE